MRPILILALSLLLPAPAFAASVEVVMSGLDNPRGLAFAPNGALYVAESGRGGTHPCISIRGTAFCHGSTGAISRLHKGRQDRIVQGLPSIADAAGTETGGPNDVSFQGNVAYVTIGFAGVDPSQRSVFGAAGKVYGHLLKVNPNGKWQVVADISAHEASHNPAGGPLETNPFAVLAEPGAQFVTDAAGNSLLRVAANGTMTTVATFPSRPFAATDAVPTGFARGPDGAIYLGQLTGVPFVDGAANIFRIAPGQAPTAWQSGFKTIIDLDFAADGSLYVLEHATGPVFFVGPGRIIRIAPDGSRSVVLAGLDRPTGLAVGPDGALYVSNRGITAMAGEVLRIVP
ncbi:MAG TPA: ScyD/ScyE family protein [Gammaproteobacteria bacterium]|nr:ScyD/ScyE family protein [Luteimonas sp.]HRO26658.1 ScyD/ScyE family protein [Luteimonas sp.]HRP35553.1 ScyD/ScyE family protein [Gammaproteobacteria bacterium]HRP71424.1 ScyD/ScyE family protein [Luteimonas sp.]